MVGEFKDFLDNIIDVHRRRTLVRFRNDIVKHAPQLLKLVGAIWTKHLEVPPD